MDFKVMKRPMFRMGGPTSGGTGITSGLETPRQNYQGAGSVLSIEDAMSMGSSDIFNKAMVPAMLNREKNFRNAMSIPKLGAVGSIATNVLPNIERGGLKGIVDILKDPQTINAAIQGLSQTKSLELERDKQQLTDLGTIFKGKSSIEASELNKKKLDSDIEYKTESLRISEKKVDRELAVEYRNRLGIEAESLIQGDGSILPENKTEFERKMKLSLGKGFMSEQEVKFIAYKMILNSTPVKEGELRINSAKFNEAVENAASSLYFTQVRPDEADGGRINKAMGGGFDMGQEQPMQAAQTMAPGPEMMQPQGGGQDMGEDPFQILRARLPREIPDDVVSLIAYNQKAFADFANIQDQDDVDLFNQRYNVQLVVDLASR